MAIPNNYIDKIKDKDSGESRPICPPADHVSVDNENYEGETLDEVLNEVSQAIEEAGQGGYAPPQGGIPKTDLAQSVQDSLDKADSALQDEDLADYATKNELQQGLANKQDTLVAGNGIVIAQDGKTVSVAESIRTGAAAGATAYQKPASGIPASDIASGVIPTLPQNIVQSVSVNGQNPVTPDGNGNVDLTGFQMPVISISETTGNWTIDGQDTGVHAQGETGNITVTDGVVTFGLINNLSSLDTDKGLTAKMGHDLLLLIAQIYDSLGASAFWSGKPVIDWSRIGLTYKTITRTLDEHCVSNKTDGRVLFGSQYSERISGAVGYVLNSITLTMVGDANAQSYVNIDTGEINIPEVTGDITIVATSQVGVAINKNFASGSNIVMSNPVDVVRPNASYMTRLDAADAWKMIDHNLVVMMGSTVIQIVLEDGLPANTSPAGVTPLDIETDDCVVWKCDYDSETQEYSKPYFDIRIHAVTDAIDIHAVDADNNIVGVAAVNILQNNSLGGDDTGSVSGNVEGKSGWIHTKRFPLPPSINGSGDSQVIRWRFGAVPSSNYGCNLRYSMYLHNLFLDQTLPTGTKDASISGCWTVNNSSTASKGYRDCNRRTNTYTYRIVAVSIHFSSASDDLMSRGATLGDKWIIKAGRFLPE